MSDFFDPDRLADAPQSEGVHIVRAEDGSVLYVGRSENTRRRLQQHLSGPRDSSILHKRVAELLDDQLRRPATGADVRDFLSRCTVEWIETDDSNSLKQQLVEELGPRFSWSGAGTPPASDPRFPIPEGLSELRLQLLPYVGIRFRHLAQRELNPEDRSLAHRVVGELLTREVTLERGHWLTVSMDPDAGVPREQAAITSDFDLDAIQSTPFERSPLARHLEALLLVPVVKPSSQQPADWYLVEPVIFVPDGSTMQQYREDYDDLAQVVAEGPPDDDWRELGRTGRHLRAKTNYTKANPTRAYTDRQGRRHEPKRRGWYFATGYTADVLAEAGVDPTPPAHDDEAGLAQLLTDVRSMRRAPGRPHKPYLLLAALAELLNGAPRMQPYGRWHDLLEGLLIAESPQGDAHPEYPFIRLVRDGLWDVEGLAPGDLDGDVTPSRLREAGAEGGLPSPVWALLRRNEPAQRPFVYAALAHLDPAQRRIGVEGLGLSRLADAATPGGQEAGGPVPAPVPSGEPPRSFHAGTIPAGELALMDEEHRALGAAGELWVVELERERLESAGRSDLADRVDHVASRLDGLGYDVLSFDSGTGEELWIEVKTTGGGAATAYFFSENELQVSRTNPERYRLYRVFGFPENARYFVLAGPLDRPYFTRPRTYSAHPQWRAPQDGT